MPGFPVALKLGLAGGPLIMALILGRIGSIGKLYWFMPPSANLALRELGIVLFLAVVGLKSGGDFVDTLTQGEGLSWIGYGIFITAIPLITVGLLARIFAKMNYLTLCGMLAGSMTDPPALAFANNLHATSGAAALSYATVYPLVMFLRIITPQLLAVILGNGLAPDGALLIRPMHCVKSGLDNARRTGHTSALLLISFLNERANQRNGNEHNSNFFS